MDIRTAAILTLGLWMVLRWVYLTGRQTTLGVDSPINMEAAGQRGALDGPYFGTRQCARRIYWAYNGPRPLLLLFWPFAALWKRAEVVANGLWTLCMGALILIACWLLWPTTYGLWLIPVLVAVLPSFEWNLEIGTANPVPLVLAALAYHVDSGWLAWTLMGVACSMRLHAWFLVPLVIAYRGGLDIGMAAFPVAVVSMTGVAYLLGFGYDSPKRLWRLIYALQVKGPRMYRLYELQLQNRRAYWLFLPLLFPWPPIAATVAGLFLVYAVAWDVGLLFGDASPLPDGGVVWHESWRD